MNANNSADNADQGIEEGPPRVLHVRVTNRNDFPLRDMFDSVPYLFDPHKPNSIPVDAAAHIFGWFEGAQAADMKRHVQKRFGWNTPAMEVSGQHDRFYEKIEIKPIVYKMVPVELVEEKADSKEGAATNPKRDFFAEGEGEATDDPKKHKGGKAA